MPGFGLSPQQVDPNDPEVAAMIAQQQRDQQLASERAAMSYAPTGQGPAPMPSAFDVSTDAPTFDQSQRQNFQNQQAAAPSPVNDNGASTSSVGAIANTQAAPAPAATTAVTMPGIGPDVTTTTHYGETYVKPTKDFASKRNALNKAEDADIKTATAAKTSAVADANAEVAGRTADTKAFTDFQAAADAKQAEARQKYEEASKFLASERERVVKEGTTDYWHDKTDGSRVLSALSVGLGEFAAKLSGGPNTALNIINSAMDRDQHLKEKKLAAELENLGISKADAQDRLNYARLEIANQKSGLIERLAMDRDARLAKAGVGEAERKGDAVISGLGKLKAANDLKIEEGLNHQVTRGGSTVTSNANENKLALLAAGPGASDPLAMLGSNGKPAAYKDEKGAMVPIKARSAKSADELANFATKAPTLDRSLKRLQEIAQGPESERLAAIAGGEVARLRASVVDAGAVLDSTSGRTSVALINLNRDKVSDEKYFNGLKNPGKLFNNAREAARQGYADALTAHTNIPRQHAGRLVNDLLGRDPSDITGSKLSSQQIASLQTEINRNGPRAVEARQLLTANARN